MHRCLFLLKACVTSLSTFTLLVGQSLGALGALVPTRGGELTGDEPDRAPVRRGSGRSCRTPADGARIVPNAVTGAFVEAVSDGLARDQQSLALCRALAQEATQGTLNTGERYELDQEFQLQLRGITEVARSARFGDFVLLDGQCDVFLQSRPPASQLIFLDLPDATLAGLGLGQSTRPLSLSSLTSAGVAIAPLDSALQIVSEYRSELYYAWLEVTP